MIQQSNQLRRSPLQLCRQTRGILPKIGGAQAIPKESSYLAGRRAVIVPIDGERQVDRGVPNELPGERARATSSREENDAKARAAKSRGNPRSYRGVRDCRHATGAEATAPAPLAYPNSAGCELGLSPRVRLCCQQPWWLKTDKHNEVEVSRPRPPTRDT
jgi:hypothetical protein